MLTRNHGNKGNMETRMTAAEVAKKMLGPGYSGTEYREISESWMRTTTAIWEEFMKVGGEVYKVTPVFTERLVEFSSSPGRPELTLVIELRLPDGWIEQLWTPSYDTPANKWWFDLRGDAGHDLALHGSVHMRLILSEVI